jgi:L-rhamnose isomerase
LQFFQVRVPSLALGAMAFADQTGVASLLHLRRVNENGAANPIRRYRQSECRDR